jgi:calcineurin-like phosphoesterase family protein
MPETWFISDTHFGHKNILEYEKESRPFNSVEEMNNAIVDRWNGVVSDSDTVYHLGDFAFGRHNIDIAQSLKGKKMLIMGNHDTYPTSAYLKYFVKLYGSTYFHRCILSHIPVHDNSLGARWLLNVHGHLHSRNVMQAVFNQGKIIDHIMDENYFNVSCEQNNLTPINYDQIKERIDALS